MKSSPDFASRILRGLNHSRCDTRTHGGALNAIGSFREAQSGEFAARHAITAREGGSEAWITRLGVVQTLSWKTGFEPATHS